MAPCDHDPCCLSGMLTPRRWICTLYVLLLYQDHLSDSTERTGLRLSLLWDVFSLYASDRLRKLLHRPEIPTPRLSPLLARLQNQDNALLLDNNRRQGPPRRQHRRQYTPPQLYGRRTRKRTNVTGGRLQVLCQMVTVTWHLRNYDRALVP